MRRPYPFIVSLSRLGVVIPIGDITVRLRVSTKKVEIKTTGDMSDYGESWVIIEFTRTP